MRTFGSIVHVKEMKGDLSKLEDRSKPMIFIAYELGSKAYQCFDPVNSKVIVSHEIIFEGEKWTWSTQGENSNALTFLPDFLFDQTQVDEVDHLDEETEVSTPHEEISSPSISEGSQPPRYKLLIDLYTETTPITQVEQVCLLSEEEPLTYSEVPQEEVWRQVMREEMLAIDRNNTWELEKPSPNCKPIGLKWIFKLKKNS